MYIVDFYCPEKKLIVEIDGDSHYLPRTKERDTKRTQYLESLGYTVLRYTNTEVTESLDGVMKNIESAITKTPSDSPS